MTWGVTIVASEDETIAHACSKCKHVTCCYIVKAGPQLGSLLTSIDQGCDGHMAGGEAVLKCHGYEPVTETSEVEGSGEDSAA